MKKLYVVGMGPGDPKGMTSEAYSALESCSLLCGYTEYIRLIRPLFPRVRLHATPMTGERERCAYALEQASEGSTVGVVCSGDAGVYGMAGLVLELAPHYPEVEAEIVAGVTAAQSGAALLGAPLGHDYAVISLSDLLTPWEVIARRLETAAAGDFCICLYNPASKKRRQHLARACRILQQYKSGNTVCGWVKRIGRPGQCSGLLTLERLAELDADMFTTIYIGNRETRVVAERMVTPRGYWRRGSL